MITSKVGIAGFGWVGKSAKAMFPEALICDPQYPESVDLADLNKCDVVIIAVPTPLKDGMVDCSIVEDIVKKLDHPLLLIRSTLQPGTADYLKKIYNRRIVVSPEYLGESVKHPLLDEKSVPFIILGGDPADTRQVIELYQTVYNANIKIRQVTALEAEVIKLSENRAIAFKMMQCQELYDVCQAAGVDYYTIRDAVYGDDPRFNLWWTFVYPDKRGFNNSKCLVKDVPAFCSWAESLGYPAVLTEYLVIVSNLMEKRCVTE